MCFSPVLTRAHRQTNGQACHAAAVPFTAAEAELYQAVFQNARSKYQLLKAAGDKAVTQNLFKVMSTFLPARRICSGGQLKPTELAVVRRLSFKLLTASQCMPERWPCSGVAPLLHCIINAAGVQHVLQMSNFTNHHDSQVCQLTLGTY